MLALCVFCITGIHMNGGLQGYVLIALIAITYSKFRVQSARRKPRDSR